MDKKLGKINQHPIGEEMKHIQSAEILPSLRTLNNDSVNKYLKEQKKDQKVQRKISPHKNYSNYRPSVINLFPSIGQLNNKDVYTSSNQHKQNHFYDSLDYEADELPGIAPKPNHSKLTDVGKYKNEYLKKLDSFVNRQGPPIMAPKK